MDTNTHNITSNEQSISNNESRLAGDRFAAENLVECCQELLELKDTGILRNGKVRYLANFYSFAGHHALPLAESTVQTLAMREVVRSS